MSERTDELGSRRAGDLAAQQWYIKCGDGTSPFPPSGNVGHIRNRDVSCQ